MANKGKAGKSIPLYGKVAGEVVSHTELTLLGVEPDARDEDQSSITSDVPASLIRLSSLEELMSFDGEDDSDPLPSHTPGACSVGGDSLTLGQLSAQETRREMFCNTCQTGFASREEQVEHYQLDWHRYNLKRRLKGLTHVNQEEFERVAGDLSSISGSESDSTHSGKEDEPRPSHTYPELSQTPFIYFTTNDKNGQKLYAVYRSILTRAKRGGANVEAVRNLKDEQVWIVLMRSGGHFAGAVFNGHSVVAHKTFHRYTVRAKRGTAQSVRDAQGGGHAPKSAGATLRRYNEAALAQEIQDLISSWDTHVREATAIFIRTPKYSREVFVGGAKAPFSKDDPRLRTIPFPTRRPTLSEVKRVHSQMACLYRVPLTVLVGQEQQARKSNKMSSPRVSARKVVATGSDVVEEMRELGVGDEGVNPTPEVAVENENGSGERVNKKKRKKKAVQPKEVFPDAIQDLLKICRDPEDDVDLLVRQLHSMDLHPLNSVTPSMDTVTVSHDNDSKSHDTDAKSHETCGEGADEAKNSKDPESTSLNHAPQTSSQPPLGMLNTLWGGSTVLHAAAATGNVSIVASLLLHGADPVVKDQSGKTPYLVSKDKPVRDSFRRFMASHPTAYDYDSAHIPSPLTEEMERGRREKLNEKKKAQKRARREREKEMKSVREVKKVAIAQEQRVAELCDRERRALAAEKRLASQLPSSTTVIRAGKCSYCDQSLAGVVPFERLTFKYCTMNCLKEHRDQMDTR